MVKTITTFILLFCSFWSYADFNLVGKGTYIDPEGIKQPLDFNLAWQPVNGEYTFSVGKFQTPMASFPEKYSVGLILHKDKYIWVQEFTDNYFSEFDLELGKHNISLKKHKFNKPVKGDYILTVDEKTYFFESTIAQIEFVFGSKGIEDIKVHGVVLDRRRR